MREYQGVKMSWVELDRIVSEEILRDEHPAGKTGRNQPCPCGSGKKFKKCCGVPASA
jgi:uncharacterized protein YecA (UPF0149 family)